MNNNPNNFDISLIKYSDNEILINVFNLLIDFKINLNNIIEKIKINYKEIDIKFINVNKQNVKDFSILLKINKEISSDIIDPENNHLYYLNKFTKEIKPSLLLKYNVLAISIVGLIIKEILKHKYKITFFTHINCIKNVFDQINDYQKIYNDLNKFQTDSLPIVDARAKILIQKLIIKAINEKKPIGGSLQTIIYNVPKGLGLPYFNLFESTLAKFLYLIPNLKALEFQNVIEINKNSQNIYKNIFFENDQLKYDSNIFQGIEQGITSGDIIIFNTHFLPPLIYNSNNKSINYKTLDTIFINKKEIEYFNLHKYILITEALSSIAIYELISKQAYN